MPKQHDKRFVENNESKSNSSTQSDSKPYFGSYPFDLDERINNFLDSQPKVTSSKQEI